MRDIGFETLAQHQLEHISSRDVLATCFNGRLEIRTAAVADHIRQLSCFPGPVERFDRGQWRRHALAHCLNPRHGRIPGLVRILAVAEIRVGNGRDDAFDLIENQDRIHQHPDAVGRGIGRTLMNLNGRFDPVDQFVSPHAVELAQWG